MNRKPFIFEGPDACGKTTLAKAVIERYGGQYIHLTLELHLVEAQWQALVSAANYPGITIIDRHWVSEQVYGTVYRGDCAATNSHAPWQVNFFAQLDGTYVFCLPRPDKAFLYHQEMAAQREEMYESNGRILQVAQAYHQFVYGATDKKTAFDDVDCFASRVASHGGWLTREPSYIYDRSIHALDEWLDMHSSLFTE